MTSWEERHWGEKKSRVKGAQARAVQVRGDLSGGKKSSLVTVDRPSLVIFL